MNRLISVIVPVYNIEEYINRCIESIINQSYTLFELILVIDGSTDNSEIICDKWAKKDNRIRVIYQENGGVSSARNHGLDEANGDYITFIDGDDYIQPLMLEKLLEKIEQTDSDVSLCNLCVINLNGNQKSTKMPGEMFDKKYLISNYFYNPVVKELLWGPYQKLFKKELLQDIRFKRYALGEDILFVFEVLQKINKLSYVDYDGYFYVHREGSAVKSSFSKKRFDYIYATKEIVEICEFKAPYALNDANQWLYQNSLVTYRALIINGLKNTFSVEYKELREYLKNNKSKYFGNLNKRRKLDYILSMYFPFVYKFAYKLRK